MQTLEHYIGFIVIWWFFLGMLCFPVWAHIVRHSIKPAPVPRWVLQLVIGVVMSFTGPLGFILIPIYVKQHGW